jgi:hypothetical protein
MSGTRKLGADSGMAPEYSRGFTDSKPTAHLSVLMPPGVCLASTTFPGQRQLFFPPR